MILSGQAERLAQNSSESLWELEKSYVTYQNRSPSLGKGRLLLPISHPQTAGTLLEIAAAIAQSRDYDIECLQVIIVPLGRNLAEAEVQTTTSHHLFAQLRQMGKNLQVPISRSSS